MSLGKAGLIMPGNESFWSRGDYILIPPDKMDLGSRNITECPDLQPLVMFIGGARDAEDKNVLHGIFEPYNAAHESHQDIGYGTFQTGGEIAEICRYWNNLGQNICLVGHSYGGDTAMDVVRSLDSNGVAVGLVVTLDPVGRLGPGANQPKPRLLKRWLNVHVDYSGSRAPPTSPDGIAMIGGPWGFCAHADDNYLFTIPSTVARFKHQNHARAALMLRQSAYDDEIESFT